MIARRKSARFSDVPQEHNLFSPDGERILLRKIRGRSMIAPTIDYFDTLIPRFIGTGGFVYSDKELLLRHKPSGPNGVPISAAPKNALVHRPAAHKALPKRPSAAAVEKAQWRTHFRRTEERIVRGDSPLIWCRRCGRRRRPDRGRCRRARSASRHRRPCRCPHRDGQPERRRCPRGSR